MKRSSLDGACINILCFIFPLLIAFVIVNGAAIATGHEEMPEQWPILLIGMVYPAVVVSTAAPGCAARLFELPEHSFHVARNCFVIVIAPSGVLLFVAMLANSSFVDGVAAVILCIVPANSLLAFLLVGKFSHDQQAYWSRGLAAIFYYIGGAPGIAIANLVFPEVRCRFPTWPLADAVGIKLVAIVRSIDGWFGFDPPTFPATLDGAGQPPVVVNPEARVEPVVGPRPSVRIQLLAGIEVKRIEATHSDNGQERKS